MAETYDVAVIGSGPGGYVCAIKAAQLGLKVAIVEKWPTFGGTCLNIGCIPSKALLHASEMFAEAGHGFADLGIDVGKPKLNFDAMMKHKEKTVQANVDGVEYLLKKNKIEAFKGTGSFKDAKTVLVTGEDGSTQEVSAKNVVIATGSDVAGVPGLDVEIDEKVIVSSTGALELESVPKSMVIVGGGVIGLEMGSVWSRLGAKVTVVEYLDHILGNTDREIAKHFQKTLTKQGVTFHLGSKVTAIETSKKKGASVTFEPRDGGDLQTLDVEIVLVATGRRPYTDSLNLDAVGIETERGMVPADGHCHTGVENIWAIGDVTRGPMLAHKAEDEGIMVAEQIAGRAGHVNYDVIPGVVYTAPEVATAGKTEEELKEAGTAYNVGKFPFTANGRARAMNVADGLVKILSHKETDRVLGVHIVGHGAGELIHEAAVLMEFGGSAEDLARVCHAHPTLSEAVREAALAAWEKPIHI